ncbi:deoxynucleotide monophosphate kinase [Agrobacterium rosae]|uniref:Deoxynucleotide monophosphate kinase n=1 Tax=Agrobacterium rosae TaxID=1972867 RepID=A0AAW9FIP5_9HYPH|nr:deoxynucleotide monophosphate kinase [Agrobacterium rosae]MDX8302815.1 deoxynucleotide monophosphate kinase [Agrobacterium rosae]
MSDMINRMNAVIAKSSIVYEAAMEDFRRNFTLGDTITSKDTGCLTAVPANDNVPVELRALGAAIGKSSTGLPPVIALTGLAGSGKSTASKCLVEKHGYQLVKFAGPLKDMLRAIGLSEAQIEGELKEEPCEWLQGATPRHAMQTLGTQWGRACIGTSFWIELWVRRVNQIIAEGGRVVVDDCRFPNEANVVRKLGGVVWKIVGRGGIAGAHESEAGCGYPDAYIANFGNVHELDQKIDAVARHPKTVSGRIQYSV